MYKFEGISDIEKACNEIVERLAKLEEKSTLETNTPDTTPTL